MENHAKNNDNKKSAPNKTPHSRLNFFSTKFRLDKALLLFCIIIFLATLTLKIFEPQLASAEPPVSDAIQISLLEELPGLTEDGLNKASRDGNLFGYY